jgi:hypothetical protein
MSDLITTAQDSFRNQCVGVYLALVSGVDTLAERARENRGQTAAEYMGVLLVVSVIIAAVSTTEIGAEIKRQVMALVKKIGGQ